MDQCQNCKTKLEEIYCNPFYNARIQKRSVSLHGIPVATFVCPDCGAVSFSVRDVHLDELKKLLDKN